MSSMVSTLSSGYSSGCLSSKLHSQRLLLKNQSFPFSIKTLKEKSFKFRHVVTVRKDMAIHCVDPLGTSPPNSDPSSAPWQIWIVGVLFSVILPFWKNKWGPLLTLKQNIDKVVDVVEDVAEVVETVAEEVEKVADEVAEHLPEGGNLQKAAIFVENVARKAAGDADLVGDFIDKVEEVEDEIETFFTEEVDRENGEENSKAKDDQNVKNTTAETKTELILEKADPKNRKIKQDSQQNQN